jgi:hypothetical protein
MLYRKVKTFRSNLLTYLNPARQVVLVTVIASSQRNSFESPYSILNMYIVTSDNTNADSLLGPFILDRVRRSFATLNELIPDLMNDIEQNEQG